MLDHQWFTKRFVRRGSYSEFAKKRDVAEPARIVVMAAVRRPKVVNHESVMSNALMGLRRGSGERRKTVFRPSGPTSISMTADLATATPMRAGHVMRTTLPSNIFRQFTNAKQLAKKSVTTRNREKARESKSAVFLAARTLDVRRRGGSRTRLNCRASQEIRGDATAGWRSPPGRELCFCFIHPVATWFALQRREVRLRQMTCPAYETHHSPT